MRWFSFRGGRQRLARAFVIADLSSLLPAQLLSACPVRLQGVVARRCDGGTGCGCLRAWARNPAPGRFGAIDAEVDKCRGGAPGGERASWTLAQTAQACLRSQGARTPSPGVQAGRSQGPLRVFRTHPALPGAPSPLGERKKGHRWTRHPNTTGGRALAFLIPPSRGVKKFPLWISRLCGDERRDDVAT